MTHRPQNTASELRILKEAVASAVHELSQPLNVVNLLADNALEDVTTLQEAATADAATLRGLRRRIESIAERAEKASDITRWIRAFAVDIDGEATDFDPEAVIARVAGIFGNDLRVAGVELCAEPATGQRIAVGNEALLAFALTEAVLWLSRELPRAAPEGAGSDSPRARVHVRCMEDPAAGAVVVAIDGQVASEVAATPAAAAAPGRAAGKVPAALPLLAAAGRIDGATVTLVRTRPGGARIRLSLPRSTLYAD
jgi:hypothetical protein